MVLNYGGFQKNISPITQPMRLKTSQQQETRGIFTSARDNKKFDNNIITEQSRRTFNYTTNEEDNHVAATSLDSTSTSDLDDVYNSVNYNNNDESELESVYDPNDYTRTTIDEMKTKLNKMTNQYVHGVKSQMEDTCSKLKLQQKLNQKTAAKKKFKCDEKAAGDSKKSHPSVEDDVMMKKILKMKTDCYNKIDQNLKILQRVDSLTEDLYKNHLNNSSKKH